MTVDEGTREAFDAFARARLTSLLRFGLALTGDPHRAADLVQDALERTLPAWPRVVSKHDPEGYVRRAMVNRNVSIWRRRRRERLTELVPECSYVDAAHRDEQLWRLLAELPPRQRAVLVPRFFEDLSEEQTATLMGCSPGTVKSQTSRAPAKLRQSMPTEENEASWTS